MAIVLEERYAGVTSNTDASTYSFFVTSDDAAEFNAFLGESYVRANTAWPGHAGGFIIEDIQLDLVFDGSGSTSPIWLADIQFKRPPDEETPDPAGTEIDYSFNFSLESQLIYKSRQTISKTAATGAGAADDLKGFINVQPDGSSSGTSINVPTAQFSIGLSFQGYIPEAYQNKVELLVGSVNSSTFRTRPAGEVMLLGGSGGTRLGKNIESRVQLTFGRRKNRTNVTLDGFTDTINVKGWEYLWVRYKPHADAAAKQIAPKPAAAYVERLYETANLNPVLSLT